MSKSFFLRNSRYLKISFSTVALITLLISIFQPNSLVKAAPILTVTPITWNVIGLDSNNVRVGPNNFPVGVRVCNTGTTTATNVQADFVWDSANSLIELRPGSLNPIMLTELEAGDCYDFYFEVEIARNAAAYYTSRRYHIEVTADPGISISTPKPREVYVERLVSQNRNSTLDVMLDGNSVSPGGNMTLLVGETYTITLVAKTATNGYEQIESFINFPNTIFQILDVETTYTANSSATVDNPSNMLYGDGCVWQNDPNSPNYRSCLSTGKAGGNISVNYTVKIIGGSGTSSILNTLVYDFSGASYHYNSDYAVNGRTVSIVSADLSKSFTPKVISPGETSALTFKITNPGTEEIDGLNFIDDLPDGMTISSSTINYDGCGTPAPLSLSIGASSLSFSNISIAGSGTCTITVNVTATNEDVYTNTSGNLFIDAQDTGDNGSASLMVSSATACEPGRTMVIWTFPTGSSPTIPAPDAATKADNVTFASTSTTVATPAIETNTNYGNPAPSWGGQGFSGGGYFQFRVDTSKYSDVTISFDHLQTTANWSTTAAVTVSSSVDGISFTLNGSAPLSSSMQSSTFNTSAGSTYFRISATGAQNNNARLAIDNVKFSGCLIPAPAPSLTKSFSPDPIIKGSPSTLTFTINNTASGNVPLTNISFTDVLPEGLSVMDSTSSACNGTNNLASNALTNTISFTGGSLGAGESCTFNVSVIGELQGVHENVTGFLSSTQTGTSSSYAVDTITVLAPPQINKSFGASSILSGESTSLTFSISNPNIATTLTGISFIDMLPTGLNVSNATLTQCNGTLTVSDNDPFQDSISLSGASLLPRASCIFTVDVTGVSEGLKVNTVTVTSIEGGSGNTDEANLLVKAPTPVLNFIKQIGPALSGPWSSFLAVDAGDPVFYRFIIENSGDIPLTGISLVDPEIDISSCNWLDGDGFVLVDDPIAAGFTFTLPIADDDEGHLASCVLDPSILATFGSFPNTASVSSNQTDMVSSSATYATAGITLTKSATETYFSATNEILNYSYLVENTGHVPLLGPVAVTDDKTTVTCPDVDSVGDFDNYLDPGESITCTASYTVKSTDITAGLVTNTAFVTIDHILSNNDSVTVPYQSPADLEISKINDTADFSTLGTSFIWTLTVTNNGNSDATFAEGQTILSDPLPAGASYDSLSLTNLSNISGSDNLACAIESSVLTCVSEGGPVTIGRMTGSFSVTLNVTPTMGGDLENTAIIDPDDHISETDEDNNSASNTVFIAGPGLSITKQVSPDNSTWGDSVSVNVGETVYFRITVNNTGNIPLTGILISDDQCTLSSPTGDTNTNSILDITETWIYTCSLTAVEGTQTNTVTVSSNETPDASDSAQYFGNQANLSVTKQVSTDNSTWSDSVSVNVGEPVYFRITVDNTGNIPLTGVLVSDDQCTLSVPTGDTNTNSILDISETWIYTCSLAAIEGTQTNTATVSSNETPDASDSAQYFGNQADLRITKQVSTDNSTWGDSVSVNVGETVYFRITVDNTGNIPLTGVLISDDQCTLSVPTGDTNTNSILDISETWIYTCSLTAVEGTQTNTVTVSSNETPDASDSAQYFGSQADLSITKDANVTTVRTAGDVISYTIVITNSGNVTLTSISVSDPMLANLDCDPILGGYQTSNLSLAPDEELTCTGSYTVTQNDIDTNGGGDGQLENTATASDSLTGISETANEDVEISPSTLIGTAKRVVTMSEVTPGTYDITYQILVRNYGTVLLTNVQITDDLAVTLPLPTTFSVQSISSSDLAENDAYDGTSVTDLLLGTDSLAVNASGTVTLVVRVIPANSGPFANTAIGTGQPPSGDMVADDSQDGVNPDPAPSDGDPTNNNEPTIIDFGPRIFDPPIGIKTYDDNGLPLLEWTMIWINNSNILETNGRVSDPIPAGTTYNATGLSSGYDLPLGAPLNSTNVGVRCYADPSSLTTSTTLCYYEGPTLDYPLGRIIWEGVLGPDLGATNAEEASNELYITFRINVPSTMRGVNNVATMDTDLNGDGTYDSTEINVATSRALWNRPTMSDPAQATQLPSTGFAPGLVSVLPSQPGWLAYTQFNNSELMFEIPKLNLRQTIAGVPFRNGVWDVTWLHNQIGYLYGTAFPGQSGNTTLTGHVYLSNGLPGPFVNIGSLRWGDELVMEAFGFRYIYEVRETKVVLPNNLSIMKNDEKTWLTLITCKNFDQDSGNYAYRTIVRAILIKVEEISTQ